MDVKRNTCDVFDVVNFISSDWEVKHVVIGFFEVMYTNNVVTTPKVQTLFETFSMIQKIVGCKFFKVY